MEQPLLLQPVSNLLCFVCSTTAARPPPPSLSPLQMVAPVLYDQLQGEAVKLQQSGRTVAWRMVSEPTHKDIRLVNGFVVKYVPSANLWCPALENG